MSGLKGQTTSRCSWVDLSKPDYVAYHDEEWGVPQLDDNKLLEALCLEGAQAGLSWYTILKILHLFLISLSKMVSYQKMIKCFAKNLLKLIEEIRSLIFSSLKRARIIAHKIIKWEFYMKYYRGAWYNGHGQRIYNPSAYRAVCRRNRW